MSIFSYIILFTLIGSAVSLIGGILLLIKQKFILQISHYLSAFAAGVLLSAAFFDLLPESFEELENLMEEGVTLDINLHLWALVGILIFFIVERFIHHHDHNQRHKFGERNALVPLIVIGDTIHNFADGVAIAATFLISIPLGIVTSLAVAIHEIPQEISDFGLLLSKGVERSKVLWINIFSSLAAVLGALLTYVYYEVIKIHIPAVLALTAGFFIYIAVANLIPEIHSNENKKKAFWETAALFAGVIVIYFTISLLEGAL